MKDSLDAILRILELGRRSLFILLFIVWPFYYACQLNTKLGRMIPESFQGFLIFFGWAAFVCWCVGTWEHYRNQQNAKNKEKAQKLPPPFEGLSPEEFLVLLHCVRYDKQTILVRPDIPAVQQLLSKRMLTEYEPPPVVRQPGERLPFSSFAVQVRYYRIPDPIWHELKSRQPVMDKIFARGSSGNVFGHIAWKETLQNLEAELQK